MYKTTLAQYYNHPMMDGGDYGNGMGMMLISFVLFIGLIVAVVYILKRSQSSSRPHTGAHAETPLEIAKKRYAAGEITKPEFEQLKKDLA